MFRVDVLVVTPADPSDPEVVMQYKIEGYAGPQGAPEEWQEARPDGGQWSFTLPVGTMQVRVRSAPKAGSLALPSEPSPPLTFRVKGVWCDPCGLGLTLLSGDAAYQCGMWGKGKVVA